MPQDSSGVALPRYTTQGKGEPLVLIMGLGGSKEAWIFQRGAFARRHRVITFDNRGVGRAGAGQAEFTVADMAEDAIALLDHLGIDRAHILGYSLGGIVAQEIAIRYPSRVRKLILASTTAVGGNAEQSTADVQKAIGLRPGGDARGVRIERVMPALVSLAFNQWPVRLLMRSAVRPYASRIGLGGLAGQLAAPAGANTLDRLGSIRAPTLVLTGTEDRVVNPAASRILAERIPGARLVLIPGGSHALAIEMKRRFNRVVLDFLGKG